MPVGAIPGPNDKYVGSSGSSSSTAPKPIGTPYGIRQGSFNPPGPYPSYDPFAEYDQPGGVGITQIIPARYYTGAEWTEMPTNAVDLEYLQNSLIQTGLLDASGVVKGQPDQKTANAMQELLAISNQSGTDWRKALELRLKAVAANPLPTKKVPPLTVKLSNPDDLKKTLQNVAQTLYGGNLSPDDEQRFVAQYQASEAAAQSAQYAQTYNTATGDYGAGGTTTGPATPAVAAEKMIREQHPTEVKTQGFVDSFEPLRQALIGRLPGGGVG